jgi:hypothetical protein
LLSRIPVYQFTREDNAEAVGEHAEMIERWLQ